MKSFQLPKSASTDKLDMAPLAKAIVAASASKNWSTVSSMLGNGYSLLWNDSKEEMSVTRMLGSDPKTCRVIPQLLNYSKQENGVDSSVHRFVLLEAAMCCVRNNGELLTADFCNYAPDLREFYDVDVKLAEMTRSNIDHLVFEAGDESGIPPIKPTHETVYYLCRGYHYDRALEHLHTIVAEQPKEVVEMAVRAYIRGVAGPNYKDWDWMRTVNFLRDEVLKSKYSISVLPLAVAEAITVGNIQWALNNLQEVKTDSLEDYDGELFGEAIISAARTGKTDLVLKLIELARKKKLEKNPRYQALLACAAGAAVVCDNVPAAKKIMSVAQRFDATELDMIELYKWPVSKIQRLSHILQDYQLFTDIVRRVDNPSDKLKWVSALKTEYGLKEMSDEGFLSLLEHPEGLQKLFHDPDHHENIGDLFDDEHLSNEDLAVFNRVMKEAKNEVKKPGHGNGSFFRLSHLAYPNDKKLKHDIKLLLSRFNSGIHLSSTKQEVSACLSALAKASNPEEIKKALQDHLADNKFKTLREECLLLVERSQQSQEPQKGSKRV